MIGNEKKSNGAFVGLVVIIIILVVGGIYVWHEKIKEFEQIKIQNDATAAAGASIVK